MSHQIFSKDEWRRSKLTNHPRVLLNLRPQLANPNRSVTVNALADSGAQSDVWSLDEYIKAGFSRGDLHPVTLGLNAANKSAIRIEGAFFGTITGGSETQIEAKSMIYVSSDVRGFYLSYETMMNLDMLPKNFPQPGCARMSSSDIQLDIGNIRTISAGCPFPSNVKGSENCSCPTRSAVPERPQKLPFPATPENNSRMEAWLKEEFKHSVFNTCPHRPLPPIEGPPLEIHISENAKPVLNTKAADIPIHFMNEVYELLMNDVALDIIERVPEGEPVTWCHRMIITRKRNGKPRRVVDLSRLNKYCKRDLHVTESPFHAARRVPAGTWKTVIDAWNGYHSVPLRECDRHLTTFITPFGLFRYKRAVQGYKSSGDGYNRRLDSILSKFERKERIVDYTLCYDTDLEEHWWRAIDLLQTLGIAGAVLNPDKL